MPDCSEEPKAGEFLSFGKGVNPFTPGKWRNQDNLPVATALFPWRPLILSTRPLQLGVSPGVEQLDSASMYMLNVSGDERHSMVKCRCGD